MGSPIYLFVPVIRKCQRHLETFGQGTGHKNDSYIYCDLLVVYNYFKVKNALMSVIITEEKYEIYKISDFSKMAFRQTN